MLQLKTYQEQTLESLRAYLRACDRLKDADTAFYEVTRDLWGRGIPYRPITEPSELADIPYVCLRLPTGGGKTLLACHAVSVANTEYLKQENSLVLWLVPSNTIREQTLNALKDRTHGYRQALDSSLGRVVVMDIMEALFVRQPVLNSATVIIVATMQAFRVEDREGRKVYESSGSLDHHFKELPPAIAETLEKDVNGVIEYSLANVMRIHRPLVIVDEAHNMRTGLSLDTLARFRPSAIIEFTATPDKDRNPSNVLHSVSAAELKAEYMIKLPIRLETHTDWQALLADAIAERADLEEKAAIERRKTGSYIRPIMLIQAQPRRQDRETLTVDLIEKSLIDDHHIPEKQIVRATGEDKGLEGVDLWAEGCPIRFIITIQALREGWDCSFAYVLCSVAEQRSTGAVEQILGRVLRLPYCKEQSIHELNRAYAFVSSPNFAEAARGLVDALVDNGFERQEAQDFIRPVQQALGGFDYGSVTRIPQAKTVTLTEVPNPERLSSAVREKITIDPTEKSITIKAVLSTDEEREVKDLLILADAREAWTKAAREHRNEAAEIAKSPSERGIPFEVPVLCIMWEGNAEVFEEDHLTQEGWDLAHLDPRLTDAEFALLTTEEGQYGEIDVGQEGRVKARFIPDLNRQMQLIGVVENWTAAQLAAWLDYNLREFIELTPQEKEVFLTAMVGDLLDDRGMALSQLLRKKFELRKIAEAKIKEFRQSARMKLHQAILFHGLKEEVVVTPEKVFSYHPEQYPMRWQCPASDSFTRHYYPKVGELEDKGEEFFCAQFIDQMAEVEFWVRNLERQPKLSFWLQTATDKFYPDFVCKLKDGRYLVVECKGADRWSNDDSKEKRRLGELWALKSNGKCLFVMPKGKEWGAIKLLAQTGGSNQAGSLV